MHEPESSHVGEAGQASLNKANKEPSLDRNGSLFEAPPILLFAFR